MKLFFLAIVMKVFMHMNVHFQLVTHCTLMTVNPFGLI